MGQCWCSLSFLRIIKLLPLPEPPKRATTQETEIQSVLLEAQSLSLTRSLRAGPLKQYFSLLPRSKPPSPARI